MRMFVWTAPGRSKVRGGPRPGLAAGGLPAGEGGLGEVERAVRLDVADEHEDAALGAQAAGLQLAQLAGLDGTDLLDRRHRLAVGMVAVQPGEQGVAGDR